MYLAAEQKNNTFYYTIRKSFKKGNIYTFKNLFFLGSSPEKFIRYEGRNGFFIDENLINQINKKGVKADQKNIEHIFYRFLPYEIQVSLETFDRTSHKSKSSAKNMSFEDVHPFDKFRLYHLKFENQRETYLNNIPLKFFSHLSGKSRDEIEQYFLFEEQKIKNREIKNYLFACFNLQYYFSGRFKKLHPELCPEKDLDNAFLEQVCNLNTDKAFLAGTGPFKGLYHYLKRYVILFFDYDFYPDRINEDFINNFINSRKRPGTFYKKPEPESFIKFFEKSFEELKKTDKKEVKKIFRIQAKKLHPDKGGSSRDFNELINCYKSVVKEQT
ncbi:MAG: hypothetical protein ACQEQS_03010 [Thermodesulfobacteriota bacterium]